MTKENNTFDFLKLDRPIVFFDLETTGVNQELDRIVELYALKIHPNGHEEEIHYYFNPTILIPQEVIEIHGITNEFVADKPTFETLANQLAPFFEHCDLGGFNLKTFDIPMLMYEFHRFGKYPIDTSTVKVIDSFKLYLAKEKRDLAAAVKFYTGDDHSNAHSAKADVLATIKVLKHQLLKYDDLEPNTSFLHDYTKQGNTVDLAGKFVRDDKGNIRFNFGKNIGRRAIEEIDYLKWMVTGDFSFDTKRVAQRIIDCEKTKETIKQWLTKQRIIDDQTLLTSLYTAVKFKEEIHPFKLAIDGKRLIVTYNKEVPQLLVLEDDDQKAILTLLVSKLIKDKNVLGQKDQLEQTAL